MDVSTIFCCNAMREGVEDIGAIYYSKISRSYAILCPKSQDGTYATIKHCPWCGSRLPTDLDNQWFEVLETEYGLTDPCGDDEDKVPPEFHTDEWWKKRGL
jgi:hypothetical protein